MNGSPGEHARLLVTGLDAEPRSKSGGLKHWLRSRVEKPLSPQCSSLGV
jgi:hypothetical protein